MPKLTVLSSPLPSYMAMAVGRAVRLRRWLLLLRKRNNEFSAERRPRCRGLCTMHARRHSLHYTVYRTRTAAPGVQRVFVRAVRARGCTRRPLPDIIMSFLLRRDDATVLKAISFDASAAAAAFAAPVELQNYRPPERERKTTVLRAGERERGIRVCQP